MPNWVTAVEKVGQLAVDVIARSAGGRSESLLSILGHGTSALDASGENKIAGGMTAKALSEMRASSVAIGEDVSAQLPRVVFEDAEKKSEHLASAHEGTTYPWEHPLRSSSQGYDPWLEGI